MLTVTLNALQKRAIDIFSLFLEDTKPIFILRGSAGTGKTTLISWIISLLGARSRNYVLLAPTGRAARILGTKTHSHASTIHSAIFALGDVEVFEDAQTSNDPGLRFVYPLKQDEANETVFIVDEASMLGDRESKGDVLQFGSGRLLADLIQYARLGRPGRSGERGAKIIFVGDSAQLPPVGEALSPALSAKYLKQTFGLDCEEFELNKVMRQISGSAILDRATALRDSIGKQEFNTFDLASAGTEISAVSIPDAVCHVEAAYRAKSSSVVITHTNAQALELNRAIRGRLWGDEKASLRVGDLLLVNKNSATTGLLNGDLVKVIDLDTMPEARRVAIKGVEYPVELAFRLISLAYRDVDGQPVRVECRVLENLLDSPERDLSPVEQRALLVDFRKRYPQLKPRSSEFRMTIRQDPYFNALQVKYGYALTCHKAQGGEWDTAVVNFSDSRGKNNEEFFRWAYTAITRAKRTLFIINAPRFNMTTTIKWGIQEKPTISKPIVETGYLPCDQDWNQFSFNCGQEELFVHYTALRDAWKSVGITIDHINHLQFCERYLLSRDGKRATVQYQYKKNLKVSTVGVAPGTVSDSELLSECLSLMKMILLNTAVCPLTGMDPFLAEFRDRVESSLAGSDIYLVSIEPMPYRLRFEFKQGSRRVQIDFIYNKQKKWTHAEEVGRPGSSQGIINRVRRLLEHGA